MLALFLVIIISNFWHNLYSQAPSPVSTSLPQGNVINIYFSTGGPHLEAYTESSALTSTHSEPKTNTVVTPPPPPKIKQQQPAAIIIPEKSSIKPTSSHNSSTAEPGELISAIQKNKLFIGSVIIVTAYSTLFLMHLYYEYNINQSRTWSSWRSSLPLEELYQMPLDHLLPELVAAINRKYKNSNTGIINQLYQFEHDIEAELILLHNYLSFVGFLKKTYLIYILPNQNLLTTKAEEKIKRLEWLQRQTNNVLLYSQKAA